MHSSVPMHPTSWQLNLIYYKSQELDSLAMTVSYIQANNSRLYVQVGQDSRKYAGCYRRDGGSVGCVGEGGDCHCATHCRSWGLRHAGRNIQGRISSGVSWHDGGHSTSSVVLQLAQVLHSGGLGILCSVNWKLGQGKLFMSTQCMSCLTHAGSIWYSLYKELRKWENDDKRLLKHNFDLESQSTNALCSYASVSHILPFHHSLHLHLCLRGQYLFCVYQQGPNCCNIFGAKRNWNCT